MKKLLIGVFFSTLTASAFAAGYGSAGCGLGSMILGDKPGFTQVFAATTNGTSASQTFGISSGTSNCGSGGKTAAVFIEANKVSLSNDIARGNGETLSALAQIYGVSNSTLMGETLKTQYNQVFNSNDAILINKAIIKVLKTNKLI